MKNFMLLAVICFAISSCHKEVPLNKKDVVSTKLSNRTIWESYGTLYQDLDGSYYCGPPAGGDCGIYSIVGSQQVTNAISSLDGAISSGTTAIASFFNGNQVSTLFPNIDSENLALLQSGDYYLLKHTNENGDISYFVGGSSVSTTNYEYVLCIEF